MGLLVVLTFGIPLMLIAHLAVRGVRHQSVHIATFGVVGLLTGYLFGLWLFDSGLPPVTVAAVGVSAAAGRAVVNRKPRSAPSP